MLLLQGVIVLFETWLFHLFQLGMESAPLIIEFLRSAEVVEKVVTTQWSKPSVWLVARFQPQRNYPLLHVECVLRLCMNSFIHSFIQTTPNK